MQHPLHTLFTADWQTYTAATPLSGWEADWLHNHGSLTESIRAICTHGFRVQVLQHHFIPAPAYTCEALGIASGDSLLHREVLLCDGDEPLVFACSLLPEAALVGRYQALRELGSRPLGHWIFSEPVLKRHRMAYARLPTDSRLFPEGLLPTDAAALHGRKTLFTGAEKPLLVSEFFLSALAHYPR